MAHEGGVFLGTVSVIACDEASRPHYSPWIAALWVEPDHRRRGIGDLLLARAREIAARAGAARIYLAASEERRPYYEKREWTLHERDVPRAGMHVFATGPVRCERLSG